MSDTEINTGGLTSGQKNVGRAELHALVEGLRLKPEAITGKTADTTPAANCVVLLYDPSSGELRKATLDQACFEHAKLIDGRAVETTPAEDTYLLLFDPNVSGFIKVARGDLYHDLPEIHDPAMYTEKTDPDDADWLIFYDVSGTQWYKVKKSDLTAIPDGSIATAKIEDVSDMKLLGNVSGAAAAPAEVDILDEDDMASDRGDAVSTQQAIKAYVDAMKTDREFVALTGGTVALAQSGTGTFSYNVADFTGPGLTPSDIREILVYCYTNGDNGATFRVEYDFGSGTFQTVFYGNFTGDSNGAGHGMLIRLPVSAEQITFDLHLHDGGNGVIETTIYGAMQRV